MNKCPYKEWLKLDEYYACEPETEVPLLLMNGYIDNLVFFSGIVYEDD